MGLFVEGEPGTAGDVCAGGVNSIYPSLIAMVADDVGRLLVKQIAFY